MRVFGWQTRVRNKRDYVGASTEAHHEPTQGPPWDRVGAYLLGPERW
jgi:hypothetical protein